MAAETMLESLHKKPEYRSGSITSGGEINSEQTAGKQMVESWKRDGVFGAWADRKDIKDSSEYARELRRRAERRERD